MYTSKVAINFYTDDELIYNHLRVSAEQKLDAKIMSYEGWEVLGKFHNKHFYSKLDFLTK